MALIFTGLFIGMATAQRVQEKEMPVPNEAMIRKLLKDDEGLDRIKLAELGGFSPAAFPLYARILDDPKESSHNVMRTLSILSDAEIKGDRSQFVDRAVLKLAHPRVGVRHNAVDLLAQIGSSKDAAPVVALLSDKDWTISIAAAKTLVTIGDQRALTAMDVWLNSSSPRKDRNERFDEVHRKDIAQYRDELKQRLDKAKPPGK